MDRNDYRAVEELFDKSQKEFVQIMNDDPFLFVYGIRDAVEAGHRELCVKHFGDAIVNHVMLITSLGESMSRLDEWTCGN